MFSGPNQCVGIKHGGVIGWQWDASNCMTMSAVLKCVGLRGNPGVRFGFENQGRARPSNNVYVHALYIGK